MDNAVTTLDVSFGREPLAAFAAGLVEKSYSSWQSLLPDGFARHITESEPLLDINPLFAKWASSQLGLLFRAVRAARHYGKVRR